MHKHDENDKAIFGFWVYLMTDLLMFAALFAAFVVLRNNTFGGPGGEDLFSLPFVLTETFILLTSSFTIGLSVVFANRNKKLQTIILLLATILLGLSFLIMELNEFSLLITEGNGFDKSAFLSSFFTLVGTHGLHITAGIISMGIILLQVIRSGITSVTLKRITLLSLFWHFLDIVWIFIFSIVYLIGVL